MALTVENLRNDNRFSGENVTQFLLFLPFGLCLFVLRVFMALILWVASIILPNKSTVRQMLSTLACWTFGVYVKVKGTRDPRCSVLVANYVSCLDSLAASHTLGTVTLRKWKVPPFFASTLGIRNAAQFVRKQHFGECPSKPVLLQPEGGPTNGKGLLKFTDWPFPVGNMVQPVAITVERPLVGVAVTAGRGGAGAVPWRDALWFLAAPLTAFRVQLLPPVRLRPDAAPALLAALIAEHLQIEATDIGVDELRRPRAPAPAGASARARREPAALERRAQGVKEVLPAVPLQDIMRSLAATHSVDVTITNFLEGVTPYTPELPAAPEPGPSRPSPRYVTPVPQSTFSKSAKERQLSFQEKKAQMIAEARQRYIEKHGLSRALDP